MTTEIARMGDGTPTVDGFSADVISPEKGDAHLVRIAREAWREDGVALGRVFSTTPVAKARETARMAT